MKFSHIPLFNQKFIGSSTHSMIPNDYKDCIITRNIGRRRFLRIGTTWMVALSTTPWLMKPNSAYGQVAGIHMKGRIVRVAFKTDKEIVRKMVPKPLAANDEGLLYAFIGRFNSVYNQAALEIPVTCFMPELDTTKAVKGIFFRKLYDNQQSSVSYGKSVYGYPKQLADVTYAETHGSVEGAVSYKGKQVARIKFLFPGKKETPLSFDEYDRHFNFKSIKGIRQLAIIRWADYKEHERKSGNVEIEPFGIDVHQVIGATYKICEWVVPYDPTVFMEYTLD
jgi:hypothetical protein